MTYNLSGIFCGFFVFSNAEAMAFHSARAASKSLESLLRELNQCAEEQGISPDELADFMKEQADTQSDEFLMVAGTMSDGSKRRGEDPHHGSVAKARNPLPPSSLSPSANPADWRDKLPEGISSLEEWGDCLLEVGKYAKDDLSYGELVNSTLEDHRDYVKWVMANPNKSNSPGWKDLVSFLKLHSEVTGRRGIVRGHYPNSSIARRFRS